MVFKRRDKLKPLSQLVQLIWPKGGWPRAARYMSHRLNRLPDTPIRIARGILAGVFVAFSPFFGLHFILAALLARLLRGNVLAAILATFVGNPLTYLPIALGSLQVGHVLLGARLEASSDQFFTTRFLFAIKDVFGNFIAIITGQSAEWARLYMFWNDVFWPYLVGGTVLGILAGIGAYYLTLPIISAYQKRRRGRLKAHFDALRLKAVARKAKSQGEAHEKPSKSGNHDSRNSDKSE